jgi:hypothetical protein
VNQNHVRAVALLLVGLLVLAMASTLLSQVL